MPVLPDVLAPGLDIVFCGTGAGAWSARVGAYYAKPGNKFWPTLHVVGLTPHVLAPLDYPQLLRYGIGLTDVAKEHVGQDEVIDLSLVDAEALREKIARFAPRRIAFTSKRAASLALGRPTSRIPYGTLPDRMARTVVHVMTSPSGAAGSYWSLAPWQELAAARAADRASIVELARPGG